MHWNTDKVFTDVVTFVTESLRNIKSQAGFDIMYQTKEGSFITLFKTESTSRVAVQVQRDGSMVAEVRTVKGHSEAHIFNVKGVQLDTDESKVVDLVARNLPFVYKYSDEKWKELSELHGKDFDFFFQKGIDSI